VTQLDDDALRSQLARRAGEPGSTKGAALADSVGLQVAGERQLAARPWDGRGIPGVLGVRTLLVAVVPAAALLVIVAVAGSLGGVATGDVPRSAPAATVAETPSQPFPTQTPAAATRWFMSEPDLEAVVRAAQSSDAGVGRVVVANVGFEAAGVCGETPDPATCYPVVTGSNPPIRLRDARSDCPSGWFCAVERVPIVPAGGPFALRILGDVTIDFEGYVVRPTTVAASGNPEWSFDAARQWLQHADGTQLDQYEDVVVTAWISGAAGMPRCLFVGSDPRFGCGQAAWLTGGTVQPNAFPSDGWSLTTPPSSIRLPNGAYAAFAPAPTPPGPQVAPMPELGTFLVRAVLPPPTCIFCDGPVAEVVARLDPPEAVAGASP